MRESREFLESLQHSNPDRPRFTIRPAGHSTTLTIEYLGRSIEVPISEVLHFAARWQSDQAKCDEKSAVPRLKLHPYPLYNVGMDDPDVAPWWVPPG